MPLYLKAVYAVFLMHHDLRYNIFERQMTGDEWGMRNKILRMDKIGMGWNLRKI